MSGAKARITFKKYISFCTILVIISQVAFLKVIFHLTIAMLMESFLYYIQQKLIMINDVCKCCNHQVECIVLTYINNYCIIKDDDMNV